MLVLLVACLATRKSGELESKNSRTQNPADTHTHTQTRTDVGRECVYVRSVVDCPHLECVSVPKGRAVNATKKKSTSSDSVRESPRSTMVPTTTDEAILYNRRRRLLRSSAAVCSVQSYVISTELLLTHWTTFVAVAAVTTVASPIPTDSQSAHHYIDPFSCWIAFFLNRLLLMMCVFVKGAFHST